MLFGKSIKKHAPVWYISIFVLAVLSMFVPKSAPMWLQQIITGYITRGTFATAMFIWVMYARVLPKGSKVMTTFMSLRAPLAIGAAMLILIHNVFYIIFYIGRLFKGTGMSSFEVIAGVCSLAMWLLLLPLTITSFMPVRRRMNPVKWKKLQRLSYIFYGLIYVHVCLLFTRQILEGHASYARELAIYTAVFGVYLLERVALYLNMSKRAAAGNLLVRIGEPALALACAAIIFLPANIALKADYPEVAGVERSEEDSEQNAVGSEGSVQSPAVSEAGEQNAVGSADGDQNPDSAESEAVSYVDGEYRGSAMGYNAPIDVAVTIEGGIITDVKVISADDDDPYYTWALKEIPGAIVEAGTAEVDAVSGATSSSKGIKNAVKDALEKAANTD